MIEFLCPKCSTKQFAPEEAAGHPSACACGASFVVPAPADAPPATAVRPGEAPPAARLAERPPARPHPSARPGGSRAWVAWLVAGIVAAVLMIGVVVVLLVNSASRTLGDSFKADAAKAGVQKLDMAVTAYKVRHGEEPASLEVLTQLDPELGTPAMLREQDFIDPWGRPYEYDPNQRDPATGNPLIRSLGPPGEDRPIANQGAVK